MLVDVKARDQFQEAGSNGLRILKTTLGMKKELQTYFPLEKARVD
mgnify:CR=1 FL=1